MNMENIQAELIQIILLAVLLIKSEAIIYFKKIFLKRKKERYDILNSEYINTFKVIVDSIKDNVCKNCKVNIYLFHNGGSFLNGVSMLKYSCIYSEYGDFDYDKHITSNKYLVNLILELNNTGIGVLRKVKDTSYYGLLYDKDKCIKGFIETNDMYFDLKEFNNKIINVL